jgi:tetratricopeptide (TPR) repeat protein
MKYFGKGKALLFSALLGLMGTQIYGCTNSNSLNDAEAYYNRGLIYDYIERNWDLALADYTEAIRLNPNYAEAYTSRGKIYRVLKDKNKARKDFQRALKLYRNQRNTADYEKVEFFMMLYGLYSNRQGNLSINYK